MNKTAVSQRGAQFRFPIEEGKIHEFARACFSTQSTYLGCGPVMPPTFLKSSQFFWEVPGKSAVDLVEFDPTNPPLHAEQSFEFVGEPPSAGTTLYGETVVESITEKPSRTFGTLTYVVIATEYRDATDVLVAIARSTSVVRPKVGSA